MKPARQSIDPIPVVVQIAVWLHDTPSTIILKSISTENRMANTTSETARICPRVLSGSNSGFSSAKNTQLTAIRTKIKSSKILENVNL